MPLDLVLRYWSQIEADFYRYYRIALPLQLSWRKFMVLFRGLPHDSSFGVASGEERKLSGMTATERMEYYRKKHENRNLSAEELTKMANAR